MYFALYTVQNSIKGLCNFESQHVLECGTVLTEQRIGQGPSSTYIQNMLQISQDARQLLNREAHMHCTYNLSLIFPDKSHLPEALFFSASPTVSWEQQHTDIPRG